jgi:Carboxypeptidase regulatory-like domain/TonB-dependent Receptor Plug Domain
LFELLVSQFLDGREKVSPHAEYYIRKVSLEKGRAELMESCCDGKRRRFFLTLLLILVLNVLVPSRTSAQNTTGNLSGTVTNSSGTHIARAGLLIKNIENGNTTSATTEEDGTYLVHDLLVGSYEITVSAAGFAAAQISVTIHSHTNGAANVVLQAVGEQPVSSAVSGVVNSQSVRELPLNGRSASDLATLEPGVETAKTQSSGQGKYGFGNQMTISGGRPRQNDARLDGISVNDYANGSPGSALGVNLGVDAVEQFTVLTGNYPAQVGRSSGGVVGATTRSGTGSWHGDVFEFIRNSALDARNFFDTEKPAFRRNQFGASAGGPLWKDHTFLFADYEGLRQSQGITQVDTVPSEAARAGSLSSGPVAMDTRVLRFVKAFYPLPNGALLGSGDTGIYTFSGQLVTPENYFTTRVDQIFSPKDTFSGTYMYDSGSAQQPDELNNKRTGYDSQRQFFTLGETHTFAPQLLNSFRFGIYRVVANTGLTSPSGNALAGDPTYGSIPGQNAAAVSVPGITTFEGGLGALTIYKFHWTSIQTYDDVTWTKGTHSLRFGFGIERIRDNEFGVSRPAGEFLFNSLSDFLTNKPFSFAAALPSAVSPRGMRQTIVGSYFQDDWHLQPNLTVNLGLRYEMSTVLTEVHGKLTVLRHLTDATPHLGDPLIFNPTLRNFEPRMGFSWDPWQDGKTAVRGGFGIFDVLPLPYLFQMNELFSAPFFLSASATNLPSGTFPDGALSSLTASQDTLRQAYFDPDPGRNYVMQWNCTIQRQITTSFSLRAGYVASRAIHQPFRVEDADIVLPNISTPQSYVWPRPVGKGVRLNTNAGRITAGFWDGRSYYDALQVQIKKLLGNSGQLGASYTWGKTIDTGSGSIVGDEYTNSISSPLFFNLHLNRGLADFNVGHNLNLNFTWALTGRKWKSEFADRALGGWQIGGVFGASTGVPFTPGFAGDTLGVGSTDPNIDVPNLISGSGCGSLVNPGNPQHYIKTQCFRVPTAPTQAFYDANCDHKLPFPQCINLRGNLGRNTLIGPGLINFDFSVIKNNHIKKISDMFNMQFRAEFFNTFNRANFAPPLDNRNVFDAVGSPIANAGLIIATQTPAREIQFALKLIW